MAAPHLSPKAFTFLRQLSRHNDRTWFHAHKEQYQRDLYEPMVAVVEAVAERLRLIAPDYVPAEPKKAMYRIHRDTRFAKDKTPYKLHLGPQFQHPRLPKNRGAGFYFHVGLTEVAIGGGLYMPGPDELLALRLGIVRDPVSLRAILDDKKPHKLLGPVQGDRATRLPRSFEAAPPELHELVRSRQLYYYIELPTEVATTPKLVSEIARRFELAAPLVEWCNATIRRAIRASAKESPEETDTPRRPEPMW